MDTQPHRKRIRHFHQAGHCHELTFSCYRRMPLLTNDLWRKMLSTSIERAACRHRFQLWAFVYMPEHVHLLVYPTNEDSRVDGLLKAIKQPFSFRIKQLLVAAESPLLSRLTVHERPGKTAFRFWQEGGGYDRNLTNAAALESAIDYLHLNPVRRRLVASTLDWKWSSARFYQNAELPQESGLPPLSRPPKHWLA